jgi:Anti-sigma-K factor rskA
VLTDRSVSQAQEQLQRESAAMRRELSKRSAELEAAVRATQRALNVLAASDVQRFPLLGRRAAPAAAGQALWSRSRGLVLEAARVPPPPSGEVHQVWLVTTRGSISLGFVVPDAQGRVTGTFDTPPELPGGVLGVIVTAETAGGSASPGRRFVLAPHDP